MWKTSEAVSRTASGRRITRDRLSRSLADFAKLVEVFDRNDVTFVSVTQSFNTTTSMGRLTLNILLSFAQFEREVTAERIRDKVAASRKKGMWMGGVPPYGYRVENRKLLVDEESAAHVRWIFARFLEIGSGTELAREVAKRGIRTPRGNRIDKKYLYRMLSNRAYIGEAVHKGDSYPGEHDAIIDRETWDRDRDADLAELSARIVQHLREESAVSGFWDNPVSQEEARRWIFQHLDNSSIFDFGDLDAISSDCMGVARAMDLGYRWGSCSADGTLNFHWRVMQLPPRIIEYVVVHELVHIKVPDHSEKFWKTLGSVMPDYESRKAWLKQRGGDL